MAFDGITISALCAEFNKNLIGGRLYKIAQPESDELLLTIKQPENSYRLLLSADASLPLIYLTKDNKPSPMTAPNFCMLLRKHLQNGRIVSISQPGLERILRIDVEHLDEMGDLRQKTLIIELMGKHSNIIFCDEKDMIIDSIKHISAAVSSVREVLPGRTYFVPKTTEKLDLLLDIFPDNDERSDSLKEAAFQTFYETLSSKPQPLFKAFYGSFTGISPTIAQELCYRAGLDGDTPTAAYAEKDYQRLFDATREFVAYLRKGDFAPCIVYEGGRPKEFGALPLTIYAAEDCKEISSISALLEQFYQEKNTISRIRQKSADLRRIVQTCLDRNIRKLTLQENQMRDTEKRDTYRIYGELLNTYGYSAEPGSKSLKALNYYTNEEIVIPLDPQLSAQENAQKYFDRYGKLKRTYEALTELTEEVRSEVEHLQSILASLELALAEEDLVEIRQELVQSGYIKKHSGDKKAGKIKITSKPYHYISSDGYDIYVGKNNFQNDELTFKFANGGDWWFHAKKMPGSHVLLRAKGTEEIPDRAYEEAAALAAYYSSGRDQEKVEIDYVRKKEVKKPSGAKPGFVVYYTNYSMAVAPDISNLKLC